MDKIKSILKLIRVKHYLKNVLIFLPLFFSGNAFSENFLTVFLAFLVFCFVSSAVYVLNDLFDCEKDRLHPKKCKRPIASGAVSKKEALLILFVCFAAGLALSFVIAKGSLTFIYPLVYCAVNIIYSMKLKHIPIIDIALLTSGFFIRVLYGGAVINVTVSAWLYLTITAIAFYLALGKREKESRQHPDGDTRKVLKAYTPEFLEKFMNICLALAIVFYSLWAKDLENSAMIWTVPLVILIAMKYSLDINSPESDGDPIDVILGDVLLIIMLAVYAVITAAVIYFPVISGFFK